MCEILCSYRKFLAAMAGAAPRQRSEKRWYRIAIALLTRKELVLLGAPGQEGFCPKGKAGGKMCRVMRLPPQTAAGKTAQIQSAQGEG